MPWSPTHRACGPSPRRHARVRPEAVAPPNRGLGLASRHPEEIVAGLFLARRAPSRPRRLAEPAEDLHGQRELPLEVRIKLISVTHGEEPLRLFVASKMLTKRHVAFEHFGRHVLHCFFALPSIKAASMRWLAPLNSTSLPWWTILSIMADASLSSPRTVPHFENSMFVVNIMLRLS